jgi:hypothetical protein
VINIGFIRFLFDAVRKNTKDHYTSESIAGLEEFAGVRSRLGKSIGIEIIDMKFIFDL